MFKSSGPETSRSELSRFNLSQVNLGLSQVNTGEDHIQSSWARLMSS